MSTKIKWEDVAHHYAKSKIQIFVGKFDHGPEMGMIFEKGLHDKWEYSSYGLFIQVQNGGFLSEWGSHKPLLRPLSSMTEDERKELWRVVFSQGSVNELGLDFTGKTQWIDKKTYNTEPRWVMMHGLGRLGIEMNGYVWADSDLHHFKHNPNITTNWLISKGFDVFGLLESGQAATIERQPYEVNP